MKTLRSYLGDKWVEGSGAPQTLVNPATEEPLHGIEFAEDVHGIAAGQGESPLAWAPRHSSRS